MEKTIEKRLARAEVPAEQTWNLEDLYKTEQEWFSELKEVEEALPSISAYKGRLAEGAGVLLACLEAHERIWIKIVQSGAYATFLRTTDGTEASNQEKAARHSSLSAKVNAALSFIDSEILSLPEGTLERYFKEEIRLEPFRISLEKIMDGKKHQLSPETEEALAALGEVHASPYKIYEMSKLADMQFDPITDTEGGELPVSFALYEDRYEFSPDTEIRRKAYQSFTASLHQYKNTFAAAYSAEVSKQVALSRLRGYESVTHMLLDPQQVSIEMYDNQLTIIQQELAPHMRRFARLKERVLGLDKIRFCDLKAPLDPDFNPETTYEEAGELIMDALGVMGEEYSAIMKKGLTERWVDRADNIGKATGAFCSVPYGTHPYILITFQNTMRSAFILAHELGHAGHFYLANENQRIMNTRPSAYFVEAPSTMNEMLLGQHLLKKYEDQQMRRWVITQMLGTYYHNFVTHLLEGEFQRRVYQLAEEGEALTAKALSDTKAAVLEGFWGDTVELDEAAALTWMRQPHYYMGLYPYTYSAGLTVSTAVSRMIAEEGQPVVDRWLGVLRAGGTMKPEDLCRAAGIDMTKPDAIRKAVAYVGELVDELERSYQ